MLKFIVQVLGSLLFLVVHVTAEHWPPSYEWVKKISDNDRITIASVNHDYMDFYRNWLASVKALGHKNYVIIALDKPTYDEIKKEEPDHVILPPFHDGKAVYKAMWNTDNYRKLVYSRPRLMIPFLDYGFTILYSDIDMVWLRDPYEYLDPQIETDIFVAQNAEPGSTKLCTGLMYLRPSYGAKLLMNMWLIGIGSGKWSGNQIVLASILASDLTTGWFLWKEMDPMLFPNGKVYFITKTYDRLNNQPIVVHANWMVGRDSKKKAFQEAELWTQG